jgi:O-antigen/teichoic acid export membrane protein
LESIKKLAGQSAIYGLSSIVGRFLNYLLVPLHTNVFSQPGEYGVVTEFYAYISFLMIIYTYGLETSFFHFSRKYEGRPSVFSTIMGSLLISTLVFTACALFYSEDISRLIQYTGHPEYVQIMALVIGFDALTSVPFARLRYRSKARKFALIKIANIMVNILLNLFFFLLLPFLASSDSALSGPAAQLYNEDNRVVYVFISNLAASGVTFILLISEFRFSFSQFNPGILREVILYSSPLLIAGLAGMVNETLDRVMIKYLVSDKTSALSQLGIYGACYKLSIIMTLFIQAFKYAAEPFFFSQFGKEDAKQTYVVVMKYFVLTCSLIFLVVMLYIDVFKYFIGPSYRSGLHIVPVLLLANMFLGIFFNLSMWYKMTGRTRFGAAFAIIGAMITIAGNLYLIPRMGYEGAAWTTLICYSVMMIISYFIGMKYYPVNYKPLKLLGFIVFALLMYRMSVWVDVYLNFDTLIRVLVNTLILFIFIAIVYRFDKLKELR